jgi:transcriptional regulator of met regulon
MKTSKLTAKDKLMFKRLGIHAKLLQDAGIRRVTNPEARGCGIKADPQRDMAGLLIPYLNPETGDQEAFRLRRDRPETKDGRPQGKYMCPPKSKRALYFPPYSAAMLEDLSIPIVMVESEKAALALRAWSQRTKNTILPVAMGGCFGYRVNNGPGKKSTTVDDLKVCNGRNVIIMLDTNVSTNRQVQAARDALSKELLNRHSSVFVATLPQVDGVNGPDDLIALKGGDERMKVVLAEAAAPPTAPYSDDMLAKRFTKKQGFDWRFVATQGRWFHWNEQYWKKDDTKQIVDEIRLACREAASVRL